MLKCSWTIYLGIAAPLFLAVGCNGNMSDRSASQAHEAPAGDQSADANKTLKTIPAIRDWAAKDGVYYTRDNLVIWTSPAATEVAQVLQQDLQDMLAISSTTRLITGKSISGEAVSSGDVVLMLGSNIDDIGREGYELTVNEQYSVTANSTSGLFYGTRTYLQLLRQSLSIPYGEARDWPRYEDRGMMVDTGRQHFSVDWIKHHIKELAYLKMNRFHWHFTEINGWRIESETHPEIVSEQHISKDQVREIVALAARYHVEVIPEINLPGHFTPALVHREDLQLKDILGQPQPDKLDITQEAAYEYAKELIEEYLPLFPSDEWHTGADEYLAVGLEQIVLAAQYLRYPSLTTYAVENFGPSACGPDTFLNFLNRINALVKSHGRILRVWHDHLGLLPSVPGLPVDGCAVSLDSDIIVEWWANHSGPEPQHLLERGHKILNAGWFPTYYVSSAPSAEGLIFPFKPDIALAYESWEPHSFNGPMTHSELVATPGFPVDPDEPNNLGSKLHVWNDSPQGESEDEIAEGIFIRLRVLAQKTWGTNRLTESFDEFTPIADTIGRSEPYTGITDTTNQ